MTKHFIASRSVLAALGFTVLMMAAALILRRVVFGDLYLEQAFFAFSEPTPALFAIGVLIKFFYGLFAAMIFGHLAGVSATPPSVWRMTFMFGAMHFVAADLGYLGRADVAQPLAFLAIEGAITILAFGGFGLVLNRLFVSGAPRPVARPA